MKNLAKQIEHELIGNADDKQEKQLVLTYPETKTPVPNRKSKEREAPRISKVWPPFTVNGLGSGGLKLGGTVKEVSSFWSSLVVVEVEVEERGVSEVALIMEIVLLGIF